MSFADQLALYSINLDKVYRPVNLRSLVPDSTKPQYKYHQSHNLVVREMWNPMSELNAWMKLQNGVGAVYDSIYVPPTEFDNFRMAYRAGLRIEAIGEEEFSSYLSGRSIDIIISEDVLNPNKDMLSKLGFEFDRDDLSKIDKYTLIEYAEKLGFRAVVDGTGEKRNPNTKSQILHLEYWGTWTARILANGYLAVAKNMILDIYNIEQ